jgi:hypothetical protein
MSSTPSFLGRVTNKMETGHAVAQAVSRRLPTAAARVQARVSHIVFAVGKAALGQVFSEYFGFPCQAFHRLLHTHHNLSSGAGTIGQIVASVIVDAVPH